MKNKVYIFGGMNENKKSTNLMRILESQGEHWKMGYPDIQGKPPSERFDHCMIYMKKLHSLVIFGGRNFCDEIKQEEIIYNDLFLFLIPVNTYLRIDIAVPLQPRYLSSMVEYEDNFYIFGGYGEDNFINGKFEQFLIDHEKWVIFDKHVNSTKKYN